MVVTPIVCLVALLLAVSAQDIVTIVSAILFIYFTGSVTSRLFTEDSE